MSRVYVSLGSNIQPAHYIRIAVQALQATYDTVVLSSVYESDAVGFDGDNFYNLVAGFDADASAQQVNAHLHQIEQDNHRLRGANIKKFSARTLDLDLLLYDDAIINQTGLQLPRNEITQYAFVLKPLAELIPRQTHPVTQQSYADLWQNFDASTQPLWKIEFFF